MLKQRELPCLCPEGKAQIALADWIARGGLRLRRGIFESLFARIMSQIDNHS